MRTVVAKFGGTSLASGTQFRKVKDIITADPARRIVVASAPGKRFPEDVKVTDMLLWCYELAAKGVGFDAELEKISQRYENIIKELGLVFSLKESFDEIRKQLILMPNREYMASRGEFLNAQLLAAYLGYTFVDPAWCVCFTAQGEFDLPMTLRAMGAALRPLKNAVVAGFYGADDKGVIRTFSRGGSDITGSLAAAAVGADLYENWTDVSGLLAADPRIVENPRSVHYLSYRELRTLSYMGASVLHTDAVLPVSDSGIPINIRNTNAPEDAGTMIVRKLPEGEKYPISGVAGQTGMSVIQVEKVMVSDGSGFSAVMLDILKKRSIPFEQCLTGIDTITLVIRSSVLENCRTELLNEIEEVLKPDFLAVKDNLSMIAVIGEKATESCDANARVIAAIANAGIEISTINQGAGKLNLLIGVPEEHYEDAVRVIYGTM